MILYFDFEGRAFALFFFCVHHPQLTVPYCIAIFKNLSKTQKKIIENMASAIFFMFEQIFFHDLFYYISIYKSEERSPKN